MSRGTSAIAGLAAVAMALAGAPLVQAHTETARLGDLPVLEFEPQVAVLAPGASLERALNTTMNDRVAWWTVVLCHCEPHRLLFSIRGPPGLLGEEFLVAPPTYHHYALYYVHWEGPTTLKWTNVGNKTLVVELRAGVWPPPEAPAGASAPVGPFALETLALAAGLVALTGSAWWARHGGQRPARGRARPAVIPPRRPRSPGSLLVLGLALALAASAAAPTWAFGAEGAEAPPPPAGPPTRAAPPPEANLTVVKISTPLRAETLSGTVSVRGVAYVNETEAARIGMTMTVERVFVSFNFGPFAPAEGVSAWNFTWDTAPFDNGPVWVGAAALDSMGNYSYDWISVFVDNGAHPTAQVVPSTTRGFAPLAVTFAGLAQDADGTVAQVRWDFGDGTSATGTSVEHTFAAPGLYLVTLTAVDDRGTLGRARVNITALDPAGRPQCAPEAIIAQGPDSLTVTFTGRAWDDGSVASVEWDFGDGATAAGPNATHTYTQAGNYTVRITVRDDEGNTGNDSMVIAVPEPLTARTDFPNLAAPGAPPDFRGELEVYTAVPAGRRISVILPPLRAGDQIAWRFVACACAGVRNFSFWVEAPSGERLLPVAVDSASALVVGWNALTLGASGVYQLVWESGGPGDLEVGYSVRTSSPERGPPAASGPGPQSVAAGAAWAGAAGLAGLGLVRRRAGVRRNPVPVDKEA